MTDSENTCNNAGECDLIIIFGTLFVIFLTGIFVVIILWYEIYRIETPKRNFSFKKLKHRSMTKNDDNNDSDCSIAAKSKEQTAMKF